MMRLSRTGALAGTLLVLAGATVAQDSFELYRPLQTAAVRAERERRVRDLYADAKDAEREAALALFDADRAAGPVSWQPSFTTLNAVEQVLEGRGDSVGPDIDADFLAALDLRLVPGAFAATSEGRGEPITVHLETTHAVVVPPELVIGLEWIAPDGSRTRARTESFAGSEFGAGLEMYVRAPHSEASEWRLAPLLVVGGSERIGHGVPVSCFGDRDALHDALRAGGDGSREEPHRVLWTDWNRLRDFGVRSTSAASFAERVGHFGLPGGADWTHVFGWIGLGEEDRIGAWGMTPSGDASGAVLIVTDGKRDETDPFAGSMESRWKRFADDRSRFVLTAALGDSQEDAQRLSSLLGAIRDQGLGDLTVVASGDAAVLLPALLRKAPEDSFDRLLLYATPTVARGVRVALDVPVLGLAYGQDADAVAHEPLADEGAERVWVRRRGPAFLSELEVPELLGRWLDGTLE